MRQACHNLSQLASQLACPACSCAVSGASLTPCCCLACLPLPLQAELEEERSLEECAELEVDMLRALCYAEPIAAARDAERKRANDADKQQKQGAQQQQQHLEGAALLAAPSAAGSPAGSPAGKQRPQHAAGSEPASRQVSPGVEGAGGGKGKQQGGGSKKGKPKGTAVQDSLLAWVEVDMKDAPPAVLQVRWLVTASAAAAGVPLVLSFNRQHNRLPEYLQ